ncbi:hypothetical protein F5879DRAFT_918302 [Lentinula edodes]|uniref:Uncharacterized protein n=1 Tax=Lentinula edodes TaxID=5353 RepID=A0A1Q3E8S3_LENED|nr:hypothetical protein HHX47_DHR1001357 [Lentinula edodes]KAJ3909523.1 hypothetical protein F5879DRAFT_918302 [Lentinula edodes]GAW03622.1 hypothetical protein LENED_005361 [Lentinula edodes]
MRLVPAVLVVLALGVSSLLSVVSALPAIAPLPATDSESSVHSTARFSPPTYRRAVPVTPALPSFSGTTRKSNPGKFYITFVPGIDESLNNRRVPFSHGDHSTASRMRGQVPVETFLNQRLSITRDRITWMNSYAMDDDPGHVRFKMRYEHGGPNPTFIIGIVEAGTTGAGADSGPVGSQNTAIVRGVYSNTLTETAEDFDRLMETFRQEYTQR